MKRLNLGTWKTRVVTARETRSVASRYAGTRENQPGLVRGRGTKLHHARHAGGRVIGPADRCDVRIAVTLFPCEVRGQTREPVVDLVCRHVERQHRHGFGRPVAAHVMFDVRDRLGLARPPHAKEPDLVARHETRIHRPTEPGPAVSERRDLELLNEGEDDLDREPRDDERHPRMPAPASELRPGHVSVSADLMMRRFPEGSSGMRSTGSTLTPIPRKLSSSRRSLAANSAVNWRVGTMR